ncbi:MAG: hypothetical protein M3R13_04005 [Armatimonadota bacterium]|nr:hypothetical protein [Armatimonadota bacterium]
MTLNEWAVAKKTEIFGRLGLGQPPPEGTYEASVFRDGLVKGKPQMGATTFTPSAAHFEYIFPDSTSTSTVLDVCVEAPERIVFLPVPEWVVEEIWQGDVSGTPHFESEATAMLERFRGELEAGANEKHFGPQPPKRRE